MPTHYLIYKMKIICGTFETDRIVYFINNESSNRKAFILGKWSTNKYVRVIELVFKRWINGNQSLNNIMERSLLMLLIPHSVTTFFDCGRKSISLTHHRTFTTQFPRMPILINSLPKDLSIRYYNAWHLPQLSFLLWCFNVVMVNMETVIAVNFESVIIVISFRRNQSHYKSLSGLL